MVSVHGHSSATPRGRRRSQLQSDELPQPLADDARKCSDNICGCETVAPNFLRWRKVLLVAPDNQLEGLGNVSWYEVEIASDGSFRNGCIVRKHLASLKFHFCTAG